jgi:hypothetical protein
MEITVRDQRQATELNWIFRPGVTRPHSIQQLAGKPIHATGPVGSDGETDVVLHDGTRLRAKPAEIVAK